MEFLKIAGQTWIQRMTVKTVKIWEIYGDYTEQNRRNDKVSMT